MPGAQPDLLFRDFRPRSQLHGAVSHLSRPRFPAIDAHNHLGPDFGGDWISRPIEALLAAMDETGIRQLVDLDGGWGEAILDRHLAHCKEPHPDRFILFGGIAWDAWPEHGNRFGEWAAGRLEAQVRRGAQGLKAWKVLGLRVRDPGGKRVAIDDPRLDPVWARAGELDIPVMLHYADPIAFFDPLDAHNELYECLAEHPDWHFYGPEFPPFGQLIEEFEGLVARHPATTFIAAHVASYPENLGWVAAMLDRYPNLHIDISARINELGRQPYRARDFFIRYQDRILFGTDCALSHGDYAIYFRFLETRDEYFPYSSGPTPWLGRWQIYGLGLPDEVLRKVYHDNAARVLRVSGEGLRP